MFFYLSKILLFLLKPLIWVLGVLLSAIWTKDESKRKRRLIIASLLLFLLSNNFLVNEAFLIYEDRDKTELDSSYEVGLVLGGFSKEDTSLNRTVFFEANDRLMQALRAYKKGLIKKIMISSGNASVFHTQLKEGDAVHNFLLEIGVPDSAIIVENQSRNTLENIQFSRRILDSLGVKSKILVFTSAWHIPRTRLCTNNQMDADFFATNHFGDPKRDYTPANLLVPTAKAISNIEILLKEIVGYVFYLFKVS
ncbi:MAG: YdcF family protein [Bacteroidia bacterium]|nr:YdcF family protein [Bacteroidia bacterium]